MPPLTADTFSLNADNVRVAGTGAIYNGPTTTPLPTAPMTVLDAAFLARQLGYLSEAGIVQSIGTSTTNIKAWQNGDIVRKVQTEQDVTYKLELQETTPLGLETYYGNYTAIDGTSGVSKITGAIMPNLAWIMHVIDGDARIRLVVPSGQITDRGDTAYTTGNALVYPVTITAYPDANGVKVYKYLDRNVSA